MNRFHARVHGSVQGVGFRWFVVRKAEQLSLTGWVRNCADGAVEVLAEGAPEDLGRLLEALRRGPTAARVTRVEEAWDQGKSQHGRFEVRH